MKHQDKILSLTKYVDGLTRRLTNIPERRKHQAGQYTAWLQHEIAVHTAKIEALKTK